MKQKWILVLAVVISVMTVASGAEKSNDEECNPDDKDCAGQLICTSKNQRKVCKCPVEMEWDADDKNCVPIKCTAQKDCPRNQNLRCKGQDSNKVCKCLDDRYFNAVLNRCDKRRTEGESCTEVVKCLNSLQCKQSSMKCECPDQHKWNKETEDCEDFSDFVPEVAQNFWEKANDQVSRQITKELQASHIYRAYASYFARADVALPGVAKFFSAASLEEREHAQMLIDYINERGGHAEFDDIRLIAGCNAVLNDDDAKVVTATGNLRMCICHFVTKNPMPADKCTSPRKDWKNALVAFEDALATERFVNRKLLDLHKLAEEAKDSHLTHILEHHFLDEQVKSINELAKHVTRLRSFANNNYHLGEYLFDQNLK